MIPVPAEFTRESFEAGVTVIESGAPGDCAYLIESGCCEVLVAADGGLRRIDVLSRDDLFGEMALLDSLPRTATIRTLVPTVLVRIERRYVQSLLEQTDPVIQYLMRLLLYRFRSERAAASAQPAAVAAPSWMQRPERLPAFDPHAAALRTIWLARDLTQAIESGQLELHYQPIIDLRSGAMAGVEALVRWRHPTLGLVAPDEFILLAERTQVIHRMGRWVIQRALDDWPRIRALCDASVPAFLCINLSAPELSEPGIVEFIGAALAARAIDGAELRVELTETVVIASLQSVARVAEALRAIGVGIALDDFGTGYSGLSYLQDLPFTALKIDRSFIGRMLGAPRSLHIVKSALALAAPLGLSTVAEGIEDAAAAQLLGELGCTFGQGYLYAAPMDLAALQAWRRGRGQVA
ncbi:MAG: EAL domain-containing protein [Betaproteobacteria bacterium]|nr:EAL domain-containing protein [Betaproteobacteria bacterium]